MLLSATKAPTVSERALRMLELIAKADEPPTLNELMAQLDLAKATTHRFAALLERLGFVRRTSDGKRYAIGERLAALGLHVIRNAAQFAPRLCPKSRRRATLRRLMAVD